MKLYNKSSVKELSPDDFIIKNLKGNIKLKNEKPTLIIFYAHWCPHCHSPDTTDMMKAFGDVLPHKTGVDVAGFNCAYDEKHEDIAQQMGINGYPTIMYYNGKMNEYQGPRDLKQILEFMIDKS